MFINELKKLGLSTAEAKVYSSLIKDGDASATQLSKRTSLGRTNVYEYASSLENHGLISQYEKNSKMYYRVEDPSLLKDMANEKLRLAKELNASLAAIYPNLEDMFNVNSSRPIIRFYTGERGYREVMEMFYFDNNDTEINIFVEDLDNYSLPEPKYRSSSQRNGLFTKLYTNSGEIFAEYAKRDEKEHRKTLLLSPTVFPIKSNMIVSDDKVCFGEIEKKNFKVTLIKNLDFAIMMKAFCRSLYLS